MTINQHVTLDGYPEAIVQLQGMGYDDMEINSITWLDGTDVADIATASMFEEAALVKFYNSGAL